MVPLVTCCLAESNIAASSVRIVRCIVFWIIIINYNNDCNGMNIRLSCNENRMFYSFYNIPDP